MVPISHKERLILFCIYFCICICFSVLSAIFSGVFPLYGYARLYTLIASILVIVAFLVIKIHKRNNIIYVFAFFVGCFILSYVEYLYLTNKQDETIKQTIRLVTTNKHSYSLLSEISENYAEAILDDTNIQKNMCGVSYFYGFFYLCATVEGSKIIFMIDISNKIRTIRVYRESE